MTTALRGCTSLEPQQGTNENAEPCLAGLYGPISGVISKVWWPCPVKDIKIGTFTIVGFTCHGQPTPNRKGMELNGINYKRTVQDAGWNPQVRTYKLRLGKGLPLSVLTSYFLQFNWCDSTMIRYKWVINIYTCDKQLQMTMIRNSPEPSKTISPYPWEMVLNRPEPFSTIS